MRCAAKVGLFTGWVVTAAFAFTAWWARHPSAFPFPPDWLVATLERIHSAQDGEEQYTVDLIYMLTVSAIVVSTLTAAVLALVWRVRRQSSSTP